MSQKVKNSGSRTFNSMKNIIMGFMSQGIVLGVGFVNRIVFTRCLTAEYLGVNGLFTNILSMLSLAELGIGTAIVYALYKPLAEKNEKEIAILMNYFAKAYKVIGCVVAVVGVLLLPFLDLLIGATPNIEENIYVIYLLYLFNTSLSYFFTYKSSLLTADQKNYVLTSIYSGIMVLQCVLQCIILVFTQNYILYLVCQVVGTLIYNIIISKVAEKEYSFIHNYKNQKLDNQTQKALFINIKALVITKISGILVNSTDNIIITALKGLKTTGLSSNYVLLTNTLNSILTMIFSSMTASIGNANAVENDNRKKQIFYAINLLNFWLYGWCTISFIVLADDIIKSCFGEQYLLPLNIVVILAINFYTVGMQNAVWTYYSTLGLFDHGKYLGLITGLTNLVLSIVLGNMHGLFGILVATFISRLLTNLWYSPYALFRYGFHGGFLTYCKRYLQQVFQLMITMAIVCMITRFKIENFYIEFGLKLLICVVMPNVLFLAFTFKTEEFQELKGKLCWIIKQRDKYGK